MSDLPLLLENLSSPNSYPISPPLPAPDPSPMPARDYRYYIYTVDGDIVTETEAPQINRKDGTPSYDGTGGEGKEVVGIALANHSLLEVAPTVLSALGIEPGRYNMSAAPLTEERFDMVVVVIADGFGWNIYSGLREMSRQDANNNITENSTSNFTSDYIANNITAISNRTHALTAFPSKTNVATAMMLTGRPPLENGVKEKNSRRLKVEDILEIIRSGGMSAKFIEGDIRFLDMEMSLNIDDDGDGFIDDDILEEALATIEKGNESPENSNGSLVVVHFHGIDDAGHSHGIFSAEHLEAISRTDGYIGELRQALRGQAGTNNNTLFMVVADHGMHNATVSGNGGDEKNYEGKTGTHGDFRHEDMYSFLAWEGIYAAG